MLLLLSKQRKMRACTCAGIFLFFLLIGLSSAQAAGSVEILGSPKSIRWTGNQRAYVVSPEIGLKILTHGPTGLLLELRSRAKGTRVIVDIVENNLRSRNAVKLRAIGGGTAGYRFVTLLSMAVPEGEHTYEIRAQGAEMVAIILARPRLIADFAILPFESMELVTKVETLVSEQTPPPPASTQTPPPGPETTTPPAKVTSEVPKSSDTRDADIFGSSADVVMEYKQVEGQAQEFTQTTPGLAESAVRLALKETTLSMGGSVYSSLAYGAFEDYYFVGSRLQNFNSVNVFLDSRPVEELRAYVMGRIIYSPQPGPQGQLGIMTAKTGFSFALEQLWMKFDIARTVFVTFGSQPVKWGTGTFWNPTDFMNTEKRNPLLDVDLRGGVPLLKLHVPIEGKGLNFYALTKFGNVRSLTDLGLALRGEAVIGAYEMALTTYLAANEPLQLGFDLSGDFFGNDVMGELAVQRGVKKTFYRGEVDFTPTHRRLPQDYQRSKDWFFQFTVSTMRMIPFGDKRNVTLSLEYFHNTGGYGPLDSNHLERGGYASLNPGNFYAWLVMNGAFNPFYASRDYLAGSLALNVFDTKYFSPRVVTMGNLTDGSWYTSLSNGIPLSNVTIGMSVASSFGRNGIFNLKFIIPAQPDLGLTKQIIYKQYVISVNLNVGVSL